MAQPHIRSGECTPLPPLGASLPGRRTHALLKAKQLELVHLVLPAGRELPTHAAPGEITLFGIEGVMDLLIDDTQRELEAGSVVHLEAGVPHAVKARTDASALLTICLQRPQATNLVPTHSQTSPGDNHEHRTP